MPQSAPHRRLFIVVGVIIVVLLTTHATGTLNPIERILLKGISSIGSMSVSWISGAHTRSAPSQRVAELEQRVAELMAENVKLRGDINALNQSADQQHFINDQKITGIQARIFARSADPTSSYVVINKGSAQGIRAGEPVIIGSGICIGKIISVTDDTARVLLTIDNRSSIASVSASDPVAQGVVTGVQGLSLTMQLIPQSQTLTVHDTIITSGIESSIPRGLIVGDIERVDHQQGELFQSAVLHTPYVASNLDVVTVLSSTTP